MLDDIAMQDKAHETVKHEGCILCCFREHHYSIIFLSGILRNIFLFKYSVFITVLLPSSIIALEFESSNAIVAFPRTFSSSATHV